VTSPRPVDCSASKLIAPVVVPQDLRSSKHVRFYRRNANGMTVQRSDPSRTRMLKHRLGIDSSSLKTRVRRSFLQTTAYHEAVHMDKNQNMFSRFSPRRMFCVVSLVVALAIVSLGVTKAFIQTGRLLEFQYAAIPSPLSFRANRVPLLPLPFRGSIDLKQSIHNFRGEFDSEEDASHDDGIQSSTREVNSAGFPIWGYVATILTVSIAYEIFGIGG